MQEKKAWRRALHGPAPRVCRSCRFLVAGLALGLLSACASSAMAPDQAGMTRDTSLGKVLVDSKGMTLYTYDRDEPGVSHCYGLCAAFWPPVTASKDGTARDGFAVIVREGGSRQWTYQGDPLYTYARDEKPGDVAGDGFDGVWHAVTL